MTGLVSFSGSTAIALFGTLRHQLVSALRLSFKWSNSRARQTAPLSFRMTSAASHPEKRNETFAYD